MIGRTVRRGGVGPPGRAGTRTGAAGRGPPENGRGHRRGGSAREHLDRAIRQVAGVAAQAELAGPLGGAGAKEDALHAPRDAGAAHDRGGRHGCGAGGACCAARTARACSTATSGLRRASSAALCAEP